MNNGKKVTRLALEKWPIILLLLALVSFTFVGCQQFVQQNPVAVIQVSPSSGEVSLSVHFDGTNSSDPDGNIVLYTWDFDDGTQTSGASLDEVDHTYTSAGTYNPTLTVEDNDGRTDTDSTTVTVTEQPGAQYIYFSSDRFGGWGIFRMNAEDGSDPRVVGFLPGIFPALRPNDRNKLAFSSNVTGTYDIWTSEVDGTLPGNKTELQTASNEIQPSWDYTGSKIAYASDSQSPSAQWDIFIMDNDGTDIRRLTEPQSNSNYLAPSIKPANSDLKIAFTANCSSASIDANDRVKCDGISDYEMFVMTVNSSNKVTALEQLTSNSVDDGAINPGGNIPTTDLPNKGYTTSTWDPNGNRLAYTSDGNIHIYNLDSDSYTVTNADDSGYDEFDPFWLPDGNTIAYVADSDGNGDYEIWVLYLDTGSTKKLNEVGSNLTPAKE